MKGINQALYVGRHKKVPWIGFESWVGHLTAGWWIQVRNGELMSC